MSLPTGPEANRKLAYIRRAKRRSKRDLSEFLRQGITPLAPFDFGTTTAFTPSANTLTLPANGRFVIEHPAAIDPGDIGILDGTTIFFNAEAGAAGAFHEIRHYFRKDQDIQIERPIGSPAGGTANIYFQELGGKLTLIGESLLT